MQAQLPDINIEFIVDNNDLDFYKFLRQNGGLPDIITCCRFSLHDAAPLKDSLMNLATTNVAGAIYNTYLNSFKNEDDSVNWLPVCPDVHGFVVNCDLFEQYNIPLPNDYAGFVTACKEFEKVGIRGYTADYLYDYTCMETHCRGFLPPSLQPRRDANGAPPTATPPMTPVLGWITLCGRAASGAWSSSFMTQVLLRPI